MMLEKRVTRERRWFVRDTFNPSSSHQLLAYIHHRGLEGGRNHKSKTNTPTTDEQTLIRLSRRDPLFQHILSWRKLGKMDSTYATGLLARADKESRIHTTWTHVPSTWRLSSRDPNLQNLPTPEDGDSNLPLTTEIRRAFIAQEGCLLVSADFSAIEAVLTGYFSGDPDYMRLARLGIHSYLVSHKVGEPADLSWSDADLGSFLGGIKERYHDTSLYRGLKRTVHLSAYGGTPFQMYKTAPDLFPSVAIAAEMQDFYISLCPKQREWQNQTRLRADKQGWLGGPDHPFHFKHWFWDVTSWDTTKQQAIPGSDWNRCVAFYPQSTAAGIIFETILSLSLPDSPWFVGDYFFGRTPLRAQIHDELLAEVPITRLDPFLERLRMAMKEPMPELRLGHDIRVGRNWADMEKVK